MFPDWTHKLLGAIVNPFTAGFILMLVGLWGTHYERRQRAQSICRKLIPVALAWLWLWSTPFASLFLSVPLERAYPPCSVEKLEQADIISILGGGMSACTNGLFYPDMCDSADRVWQGARAYKAEKAPRISLTGPNVRASTTPLLIDLGIPTSSLVYFEDGHNTEDEARMIAGAGYKKVLLVTSAWHMKRAEYLFKREGLEIVPAATDYCSVEFLNPEFEFSIKLLLPDAGHLSMNAMLFKEYFAYWCYQLIGWFRG